MPIILPTPVEFARMDRRQRDALRRRLDADALKAFIDLIVDPQAQVRILQPSELEDGAEEHRAELERTVNRRGRDRDEVVKEFNHTYSRHGGQIAVAAPILGMTVYALERCLYRARESGVDVKPFYFHEAGVDRQRKERSGDRAAG